MDKYLIDWREYKRYYLRDTGGVWMIQEEMSYTFVKETQLAFHFAQGTTNFSVPKQFVRAR